MAGQHCRDNLGSWKLTPEEAKRTTQTLAETSFQHRGSLNISPGLQDVKSLGTQLFLSPSFW